MRISMNVPCPATPFKNATRAQGNSIMRVSTKFALPLFGLLVLVSSPGWASMTKNCPSEPAQNVPIVSGETYWGTNCVLNTTGDVDSFTFNALTGDTWSMAAGLGASPISDICLTLYAPGSTGTYLFYGCTYDGGGRPAVAINQKLTVGGTYTLVVTELHNGTASYGLSLERIGPPPPDATALVLSKNVASEVNPPTAQDAYTFYGATTGTYEIAASYTSGPSDICFNVYQSGVSVLSGGAPCTYVGGGRSTITTDVTPKANATFVVVIYSVTDDGTANYNLEVSCLFGPCSSQPPPSCTLSDIASYNATTGTLTMKFTVGNNLGTSANWSAWLTYADPQGTGLDTMQALFSQLEPITNPPKAITKTFAGLSKEGKVGVLSTLSTPHLSTAKTEGIACSSWVQINTGTEP
jgi:hypothetical protein